MRKGLLNGTPIPYNLPIKDLRTMMASASMKDFSLACEALSYKSDPEAYEIMKAYLNDRDKYRSLYVLKTIFRHAQAAELVDYLEDAIASDDPLFAENGLTVVFEYRIKVSEDLLISTVGKYCNEFYTAVGALGTLSISEGNFEEITRIFSSCTKCAQKEILCEILCNCYLPQKAGELFGLFGQDTFAKVRRIALEIGKCYGFDTNQFLSDTDGHIRKSAERRTAE